MAIDFSLAEAVPDEFPAARRPRHEHRHRRDRMAGGGAAAPRRSGGARDRRGGGAEFRDRRESVPGAGRARRRAVARSAGVRRVAARAAPCGEARCAVGNRARDRIGDAHERLRSSHRRVVDAGRIDPRHAHGRVRRRRGNDHADAHRARSRRVRPRRAAGRAVAARQARAGSRCGMCSGSWADAVEGSQGSSGLSRGFAACSLQP